MDKKTDLWYLPERNCMFFSLSDGPGEKSDRHGMLRAVHQQLSAGFYAAFVGFSGTGKTSLAIEYAYTHAYVYDKIIFIQGDHYLENLKEIINNKCHINPDSLNMTELLDLLFLDSSRHLLIIDNAMPTESVMHTLNAAYQSGHKILLTSNSQHWDNVIRVDCFTHNESVQLLQHYLPNEELPLLNALIGSLGGLPLAMMQAISYIKSTSSSVESYLTLFQNHPNTILQKSGLTLWKYNYPYSAYKALQLNLEKINHKNPDCMMLLCYCAILHHENIPRQLLMKIIGSDIVFNDLLAELLEFSLVSSSEDKNYLSLHCLLHKLININLGTAGKQQLTLKLLTIICKQFYYNRDTHHMFREVVSYLPQFRHLLHVSKEFIDSDGEILKYHVLLLITVGAYETFEKRNTQEALEKLLVAEGLINQKNIGISDQDRILLYNSLGFQYDMQKNIQNVEHYYKKASDLSVGDGEQALFAELGVFTAIFYQNHVMKAIAGVTSVLEKVIGYQSLHIDRAHVLQRLAYFFYKRNDFDRSVHYAKEAIEIGKQLFPDELNFDSADAGFVLGAIYSEKAYFDYEAALYYLEYSLDTYKKLVGTERHEIIIKLNMRIHQLKKRNALKNKVSVVIGQDNVVLTKKEFRCLSLTKLGHTSKSIGKILSLSPRTIETHLENIKIKFKCRTKLELVAKLSNVEF